jgi:hypothetical protein
MKLRYAHAVAGPYPRYYAVNDRPVKLVELPTGEVDAQVFDFATGGFISDPSYLTKISGGGDVDQFSEKAAFDRLVAEQRWAAAERRHTRKITWEHTGDSDIPYRTKVDGKTHEIRVNDFPSQPLYTLIVDGEAVEDLDDWPSAWVRPPTPQSVIDRLAKTRLS